MIKDKKNLEIKLSGLKSKVSRKIELEQYQSSASLVGLVLWKAFLNGDITGKTVIDLGCGNGVFGIGALLLGAVKAVFVDVDTSAIEIVRENVNLFGFGSKSEFFCVDIKDFCYSSKIDTVVMNPPFGVHLRKADKVFLEKAFAFSSSIYSLHKIESGDFISKISAEHGFKVLEIVPIKMKVLKGYSFHKLGCKTVEIGLWVMKRE